MALVQILLRGSVVFLFCRHIRLLGSILLASCTLSVAVLEIAARLACLLSDFECFCSLWWFRRKVCVHRHTSVLEKSHRPTLLLPVLFWLPIGQPSASDSIHTYRMVTMRIFLFWLRPWCPFAVLALLGFPDFPTAAVFSYPSEILMVLYMAFLLPAQASLSILCRLTPRFLFILTCCSRSSSSVETVENLFF